MEKGPKKRGRKPKHKPLIPIPKPPPKKEEESLSEM